MVRGYSKRSVFLIVYDEFIECGCLRPPQVKVAVASARSLKSKYVHFSDLADRDLSRPLRFGAVRTDLQMLTGCSGFSLGL